jgi:hypothetical protein
MLLHTDHGLLAQEGPDRVYLGTMALGLIEVRLEGGLLVPRVVREASTKGVAIDSDGTLWAAGVRDGLVHLTRDGDVLRREETEEGFELTTVAAHGGAALATSWRGGLALGVGPGPNGGRVDARLPSRATGTAVRDGVGFVALPQTGVAAVLLDRPSPVPSVLQLPVPSDGMPGLLCPFDGGVLVMLLEYGIAVVRADGADLVLDRLVQTPGRAWHCAPAERPDTWWIADDSALLEVVIEGTPAVSVK